MNITTIKLHLEDTSKRIKVLRKLQSNARFALDTASEHIRQAADERREIFKELHTLLSAQKDPLLIDPDGHPLKGDGLDVSEWGLGTFSLYGINRETGFSERLEETYITYNNLNKEGPDGQTHEPEDLEGYYVFAKVLGVEYLRDFYLGYYEDFPVGYIFHTSCFIGGYDLHTYFIKTENENPEFLFSSTN